MSSVMTNSANYSSAEERVGTWERLTRILYLFTFFLAFTTLWAMAETKSLEARMVKYLPPIDIKTEILVR
jgi:hypothetical protein